VDEPHPRRCDAKRAAEVLVGQWWRRVQAARKALCDSAEAASAMRHVALERFTIDGGAPLHERISVYAVDADAALKACEE
jgi:hypothetical protein